MGVPLMMTGMVASPLGAIQAYQDLDGNGDRHWVRGTSAALLGAQLPIQMTALFAAGPDSPRRTAIEGVGQLVFVASVLGLVLGNNSSDSDSTKQPY